MKLFYYDDLTSAKKISKYDFVYIPYSTKLTRIRIKRRPDKTEFKTHFRLVFF